MTDFHLIFKTNHGESVFHDEGMRRLLWSLFDAFLAAGGTVLAFAILPNHVHILVRMPDAATLSRVAGPMLSTLARVWNQQREIGGVLWRPRFWRREVLSEDYFRYLIFYIHANLRPTFTHIGQLDQGLLSSHGVWLGEPPAWLDRKIALAAFGGWEGYRAYCESAVGPRHFAHARLQLAPTLDHALSAFCKQRRLRPETLLAAHRGGSPDRQDFARELHRLGAHVGEIAVALGSGRDAVRRWLQDTSAART